MQKLAKVWRENRGIIIFIGSMLVFRSAVADWYNVPTGSMQPTIEIGDRILVDKTAYDVRLPFSQTSLLKTADPQRGDIVVFNSEAANNRLVKRVVGVPGDKVAMQDNHLIINGRQLAYHELAQEEQSILMRSEQLGAVKHRIQLQRGAFGRDNFASVTVPAGHYLVLGDNRDNSADSRVIGFVPRSEIIGRANKVLYSLNTDNYYLPRTERFFASL